MNEEQLLISYDNFNYILLEFDKLINICYDEETRAYANHIKWQFKRYCNKNKP